MDLSVLQSLPPRAAFRVSQPMKMNHAGNLYKINIGHFGEDNKQIRNYEVWATKEAVQNHFPGQTGELKNYQLQRFAKRMYEDRLRVSNHQPAEQGVLVSSTQKIHGDPRMWPHSISDPEIKV